MKNLNPSRNFIIFLGVIALIFSLNYLVMAWTEPSATAPAGNVPAPLNVGNITQTKTGGLKVDGIFYAKGAFNADGGGASGGGLNIVNGDVGIGKTVPAHKLDVNGDVYASGDICTTITGSDICLSSGGGGGGGTNYWTLNANNLYPNSTAYNVGVGTNSPEPWAKLDVHGGASHIFQSGLGGLLLGFSTGVGGTAATIQGRTSGDANGNLALNYWGGSIGIGKIPSASYILDVKGTTSVNGFPITGVPTPVKGTDAVNKDYVDNQILLTQALVGYEHTKGDCTSQGGSIEPIPSSSFSMCKFSNACPSGWLQYRNYSKTSGPVTCTSPRSCGSLPAWNNPSSCTTGLGHDWSNTPTEFCYYWSDIQFVPSGDPYCPSWPHKAADNYLQIPYGYNIFESCGYSDLYACRLRCSATVVDIGCY